jgi:hypothetical protein
MGSLLSRASGIFSRAASRASERAQQAQSRFVWWCLLSYSKLLLWCSRRLLGVSVRLLDRAKAKLQRCDAILVSLGAKHDA